MPNYSLEVSNERYDPTAWLNEVQKNLDDANREHKAAQAAYAEMQAKAGMLEKLANDVKGKDSVAYQNYKNFADNLRAHTDLLATQGITNATMRNLAQANIDYQRIIHPIEEAYAAREKEADRQAKYLEQHPHAIFEKDAYDMGIDQWMRNPSYKAKSLDREEVAKRAKERYVALQKQVMEMVSQSGMSKDAIKNMTPTQLHKYVKQTAPWLYEAIDKRGVNPEEVRRFMMGDPTAQSSILNQVAQETMNMYSFAGWDTDYDHYTREQNQRRRDILNSMRLGSIIGEATNAIGESKYNPYTDTQSWQYEMAKKRLEWEKEQLQMKLNGNRTKDKLDTYYYHTGALNVNGDSKTSEVAAMLGVMDIIEKDKEFANYDANDIANAAKSALGNNWREMLDLPGAITNIRKKLYEQTGYVNAGINSNTNYNARTLSIIKNAINHSGINTKNVKNSRINEIIKLIKEEMKRGPRKENSDGPVLHLSLLDLSKFTDAEILAAAQKLKADATTTTIIRSQDGSNRKIETIKADINPIELNAIGFEISKRIQGNKWDGGISPTERRLRNLVNYNPEKMYSLRAQANQYIGNSVLSLKGFSSNYEGEGDKVHTSQVLKMAKGRQATSNGAGHSMTSGIRDEKGNYLDLTNGEDVKRLIGSDDIDKAETDLNLRLTPVIKNGRIEFEQYFVGKDLKKYFIDDDLVFDGYQQRAEYKKKLTEVANKIFNAHPGNTLDNNEVYYERLMSKAKKVLGEKATKRQLENLIDKWLDELMSEALKDERSAYEQNAGMYYLDYFTNTANVNRMNDIDNTNTDTQLYNPYIERQ